MSDCVEPAVPQLDVNVTVDISDVIAAFRRNFELVADALRATLGQPVFGPDDGGESANARAAGRAEQLSWYRDNGLQLMPPAPSNLATGLYGMPPVSNAEYRARIAETERAMRERAVRYPGRAQFTTAGAQWLDEEIRRALERDESSETARQLAETVLPDNVYQRLAAHETVAIPSTLVAGRGYHIKHNSLSVTVYEGGRYEATLCAQPDVDLYDALPTWDWLAFQYLQITANEREWLTAANVITFNGKGNWRKFPRQRAANKRPRLVGPYDVSRDGRNS